MVEATSELLHEELTAMVELVLDGEFVAAPENTKGLTRAKIGCTVRADTDIKACTHDVQLIDSVLEKLLQKKIIQGLTTIAIATIRGYNRNMQWVLLGCC